MGHSDLDLTAIRARADAATRGPWVADETEIYAERVGGTWVGETGSEDWKAGAANAQFVANARTDVPALLALVDQFGERLADAEHERELLRAQGKDLDERLTMALTQVTEVMAERDAAREQASALHGSLMATRVELLELRNARQQRDEAIADRNQAQYYLDRWRGQARELQAELATARGEARDAVDTVAALTGTDGEPPPAELRTPDQWQAALPDVVIVDPDGWRGHDGRPWDDPITRDEYLTRRARCTVTGPARTPGRK